MRTITTFCQVFKTKKCSLDLFGSFYGNGKKNIITEKTITPYSQVFKTKKCSLDLPALPAGRFVDFTLSITEIKIYFD